MADGRDTLPYDKEQINYTEINSILDAKYRNYRIDNPPLGIQQLMAVSEVELNQEAVCCKNFRTANSPGLGTVFQIDNGCRKLIIRDSQGTKVGKSKLYFSLFRLICSSQLPYITVQVMDAPALVMRPKAMNRYTMLIYDEEDQPVLDVWRPSGRSAEYKVTNAQTKADICTIRKDYVDYTINFPIDMDVRYKMALIALCAFETPPPVSDGD